MHIQKHTYNKQSELNFLSILTTLSSTMTTKLLSLVPDDLHSARRLIDDADILSTLERCFRLIHSPHKPVHSLELPTNSVPGSASSLRVSVTTYLARFLKRSVFDKIKMRQTRMDHNLFDIIWPAMKKATNEHQIDEDLNAGVVAPDFDVYVVFQEFLVPFIKDIHCIDLVSEFHPHPSMLYFPASSDGSNSIAEEVQDIHLNLDPSTKWVKECVVECSRCLDTFELPLNLSVGQLEEVERQITSIVLTKNFSAAVDENESGTYYTMNEVLENPSEIRTILASNHLLIPLLDNSDPYQSAESTAINGSHWPYGRGVYVSHSNDLVVWINTQDHLRILCCTDSEKLADVGVPYSKIGKAVTYLEDHLYFRRSYFLGYLSSRPSFLGTALRISVTLDLPHLSKEKENLRQLCSVRGLHMVSHRTFRSIKVSNMQSIGINELNTFQELCTAVANIIQLEKDLSMASTKHIAAMLVNVFRRKKNSLVDV